MRRLPEITRIDATGGNGSSVQVGHNDALTERLRLRASEFPRRPGYTECAHAYARMSVSRHKRATALAAFLLPYMHVNARIVRRARDFISGREARAFSSANFWNSLGLGDGASRPHPACHIAYIQTDMQTEPIVTDADRR